MQRSDPVQKLLPNSVQVPRSSQRTITLLDLTTHTSGLPRLPTNFTPRDLDNPYADYTVEQLYEFLSSYQLQISPGLRYHYSNLGVVFAISSSLNRVSWVSPLTGRVT